jgi:hypothetical protein
MRNQTKKRPANKHTLGDGSLATHVQDFDIGGEFVFVFALDQRSLMTT